MRIEYLNIIKKRRILQRVKMESNLTYAALNISVIIDIVTCMSDYRRGFDW
jgi:hypothetical protein